MVVIVMIKFRSPHKCLAPITYVVSPLKVIFEWYVDI